MFWPRRVRLAEFFSPVSLVRCSLGAGGRNRLTEGFLPFSRVTSKGTVCEEQNSGVVVGILREDLLPVVRRRGGLVVAEELVR